MWKVVVVLLVVGFLGYHFAEKGGIKLPGQAASAEYDGYIEVRILMQAGQREIELVAIEERPSEVECEKREVNARIAQICPTGKVSCTLKSVECSRTIEPRFGRMLDKQKASVHYAHLEEEKDGKPRRGVVLGWGMTEQESKLVCGAIQTAALKNNSKNQVNCI